MQGWGEGQGGWVGGWTDMGKFVGGLVHPGRVCVCAECRVGQNRVGQTSYRRIGDSSEKAWGFSLRNLKNACKDYYII